MVESCTAVNCCNRRTKGVKMKFHRIPINPYLRNLWLHAIRRINFTPSRTAVICEKHFTPQDYEVNVHGNRVLKKSAVPSIFNLSQQRGLNRKHDCSEEADNKNMLEASSLKLTDKPMSEEADDENVLEAGPSHLKDNLASELASGNENMLQTGQPNSTGKITSEVARVAGNENMLEAGPSNLIDRLGSSESCESSGSCNLGVCRARREPVYFEDFKFHDLNNMQRRKKFWEISHEHVQKYRKVNKYNLCRISRLKKKLESLNRLVDELLKEKKITAAQSFVLKDSLPETQKQLLLRTLKEGNCGEFSPELKNFALTLHFYSSAAYNYVRKNLEQMLCLIHALFQNGNNNNNKLREA